MVLLDTDIVIYSLKGNAKVVENFSRYADAPKAISVITYGELIFGARKSRRVHENVTYHVTNPRHLCPRFSPKQCPENLPAWGRGARTWSSRRSVSTIAGHLVHGARSTTRDRQ